MPHSPPLDLSPYRAIFFDFDYTLADSAAPLTQALNLALRDLGHPQFTRHDICQHMGKPIEWIIAHLLQTTDQATVLQITHLFRQHAEVLMPQGTQLFPESIPTLRVLHHTHQLGIVTTKPRPQLDPCLHQHHIFDLFSYLCGGDQVAEFKPHPQGLLEGLTALDLTPSQLLFVGDSFADSGAATAAGVDFIGVTCGNHTVAEFQQHAHPVAIFPDVSYLLHHT